MFGRLLLLLSIFISPLVFAHFLSNDRERVAPYMEDNDGYTDYIMHSLFDDDDEDEDEKSDDESEFDFVGHKKDTDVSKNMDKSESAVKKDFVNEEFKNPNLSAEKKKDTKAEKKDSVMNSYDDEIQGTSLGNIRKHLLAVRNTITRHVIDNKLTDAFDMYNDGNNDKKEQFQLTKNLIGLLYDFKGKKKGKHLSDTEPEDDLMDLESAKKNKLPDTPGKDEKEKIDVTVNVNINGVADKSKKKKSKVNNKPVSTSNPGKHPDELASKRSHVENKVVHKSSEHVVAKISDDEDNEDEDEDDEKVSGRSPQANDETNTATTRVTTTLAHLKDIKAPPALMNRMKEKIQEEEEEDEDDDEEDDDLSGSGNHGGGPSKKSVTSKKKQNTSKTKVEDAENPGFNAKVGKKANHQNTKESQLDLGEKGTESISKQHAKAKKAQEDNREKPSAAHDGTSIGDENVEKLGTTSASVRLNNSSLPAVKEGLEKEDDQNEEMLVKSKASTKPAIRVSNSTSDMTLDEVRARVKQNQKMNLEATGSKEDDENETRSWKSEKHKLVEKLKNPLVEAKKKGLLSDEQDDEPTLNHKNKNEKTAAEIAKSANDEFTKVVDTVTRPNSLVDLQKTQEKDVKEVEASAEKAFASVVDNVMKGRANDISLNHHALTKTANDLISNVKDASQGANMKKLMKFKSQILNEIKKINKLQHHYGRHAKGSTDLNEARSVLEKDLKVVNDLEKHLKINQKDKQAEVVNHDQKMFGEFTKGDSETIPDDKLGFQSEESSNSTPHKATSLKTGKKSRKNNALTEIQRLLKDEINRLKKKKTGKPDPKLNSIRKLVQKRLKDFLKNGKLDKNAFKKLAPEIKELGQLLKHRIKKARSYHEKVVKATNDDLAASHGFAPAPVNHKGVASALNTVQNALEKNDPHNLRQQAQTLRTAQNALARIQASNISLIGSQSSRMKNLLTSLNAKLGQMFNSNNPAHQGGQQNQQQSQMQRIQGMTPGTQDINLPNTFAQLKRPREPIYIPKTPYHAAALAKAETPQPDFEPDQTKPFADSEPVSTLIEALERDITEVWSYKNEFPNAESLGLDNEKVHNAYANLGSLSGLSLRRSLDRALRGEDVGLAIVGGSISKGGPFSEKGLDYILKSYFYSIEDYWNKIIRPVTGSSLIVRDCSIGGISTDYYSYCLRSHLPDDKLTNIVLWELSANDVKRYEDQGKSRTQPLEQFVRNVISYRAKPSLIFVNFFANLDWNPDLEAHCGNFEDEGGDDIAKYYKVTSLSWRNMVCNEMHSGSPLFTRDKLFAEDKFHPSIQGHAQVAYLIIDYIRTEFLKNLVKMRTTNIADAVTRLQIPRSIYVPRPLFRETPVWKPLCFTYMMVDEKQPNNTLLLDTTPSGSFRNSIVRAFKIRSDKIAGMNTLDKDQYVRYALHLPPHPGGSVQPYKKLGIMSFTDGRSASVQFDAEPTQIIETGKRFLEGTTIKYIAKDVRPGEHSLSVKSGDNGFLVSAIVVS